MVAQTKRIGLLRMHEPDSSFMASGIGAGKRHMPTSALEELEELLDAAKRACEDAGQPWKPREAFSDSQYAAKNREYRLAYERQLTLEEAVAIVRRWS